MIPARQPFDGLPSEGWRASSIDPYPMSLSPTPASLRLFIGVPLTGDARREIEARLRRALPGGVPGRAIPSASWYMTLRFLGPSRPDQLATIRDRLRAPSLGEGFGIRFGGLGAFPRPRSARMLWVAIGEGADGLRRLAAIAEEAARAAGFGPESRAYTPHLTLSRIQPPRDVAGAIERIPPLEVEMRVGEVIVFRSHLGGGPARYEAVERFPLE